MSKLPEMRQRKGFIATIREMIGRTEQGTSFTERVKMVWRMYTAQTSVDYSKVNYTLARAIYYASEIKNRKTSKKVGGKFLLGAAFGKPIVNAATSFIIGTPIQIEISDEYTKDKMNSWLKENYDITQSAVRMSLRDGDSYPIVENDLSVRMLDPDNVDKIVNILNASDIQGYNVDNYVDENPDKISKVRYVTEYRKGTKTVKKYVDNKEEPTSAKTDTVTGPLPIVHFANEPEPNALYGNSEYQSCYTIMANYHAVLEESVKGNIFNNSPYPYITGVENMEEFKKTNGTLNDDGGYTFTWEKSKILMGGAGTTFGVIQMQNNAADSQTILNTLFYLICQTSETPEYVFGTAVQSSKASTETQAPIMIAKAQRKQGCFTRPMKELLKLVMYHMNITDPKIKTDIEFNLIWPDITAIDEKMNLDRAKLANDAKLATKETIARIAGVDQYVEDITAEVKKATDESQAAMDFENSLYPAQAPVANDKNVKNTDTKKTTKKVAQ